MEASLIGCAKLLILHERFILITFGILNPSLEMTTWKQLQKSMAF